MSAAHTRTLRALPIAGIGFAAAAGAVALSAAPLKFAVVGLAAAFGGVGALIVGRLYRLTPVLLVALAVGLTVKLDVSFFQHFEAVGQYLPSIGGGAGLTVSVALLVAVALITAKLTGLWENAPGLRLDRPLVLTQVGFLIAGLLSLTNATDPAYLWFDTWRFVGLLLVSVAVSNLSESDIRTLALAICALCLVQTAVAGLQYVSGSELGLSVLGEEQIVEENINFSAQRRAGGLKVHPNILGYYYEFVWPLALALALSRGPLILRLVGAAGAASALVGVVLTLSRASWLTFPVSAALLILLVYRDRLFSRASLIVFGLLAIVGSVAALYAGPLIWERLTADDGGSAAQRGPLNAAALALFEQFPVFGVGLNNFGNQFAVLDKTGLSRLAGLFDRSNHVVHNLHILILTEVGIVGYAAFALVFGIGIARGFRAARRAPVGDPLAAIAAACAVGLIAHLLHGLVDPGFRLNLGIAELLYTGLGLIAGVRAAQRQRAVQARRPVGPMEPRGATRALPAQRKGTASPLASAPGAPASRTGHTPFTRGDRS
ncbi:MULTISPECIES: O-antigen ligase family protein [Methylobacterium]|uniref:O-antigen ligase family protein n=1 Tax=Methylobacterium TaxID=407 RepID=UPI001F48CD20|nr:MULTISPECIES: O-antigen ligase family protein [unclassified Methylobacterium]MDH3029789.1 O-antigen ligase family protein [Methylobacterium fujisawaense]WFS07485.1 O-antigen ligase family protein [Methylobacterium sp. 391_Methyba4]